MFLMETGENLFQGWRQERISGIYSRLDCFVLNIVTYSRVRWLCDMKSTHICSVAYCLTCALCLWFTASFRHAERRVHVCGCQGFFVCSCGKWFSRYWVECHFFTPQISDKPVKKELRALDWASRPQWMIGEWGGWGVWMFLFSGWGPVIVITFLSSGWASVLIPPPPLLGLYTLAAFRLIIKVHF